MDKIETLSIYELFSDKNIQYAVPKFQREFVWSTDQVSDLWESILQSYDKSIYLGSIVLSPENKIENEGCSKYSIIDGQQRLLVILLLLVVCKNMKLDADQAIELINTNCKDINQKIIPHDINSLNVIINELPNNNSKLCLVYEILKLKVERLSEHRKNNLFNVIINNILITTLVVSQNNSETYLFGVINQKGTSLSPQEIDTAKNRSNKKNITFSLEESEYVEFKEGAILNPHTKKHDKNMIKKVLIAIASFMNSKEGGTIYIGIEDTDRIVKGVSREYEYANSVKNNWDGYELFIADSIDNKLVSPVLFNYYKIKKEIFNKIDICKIEVKPSNHPVFIGNDFHVKTNSRKKKLVASEMAEYILTRWSDVYVKKIKTSIANEMTNQLVPSSLAKPNLYIKQTGLSSGGYERKNKIKFTLYNRGGHLYNTNILVSDAEQLHIKDITREGSQVFELAFTPPSPELLHLVISGHDANGDEVKLFLLGLLRKKGYIFENYN
ncbi:MAG: DUF262 domain-containing protein [Sulfurovaceae bacterium]|nr:DUF262 domain-containing protein [Sulfurovaceae bacterium]